MKTKKKIPIPVTEQQYKIIKMFCLVNSLKYSDLANILINEISEEGNKKHDDNNVQNMV